MLFSIRNDEVIAAASLNYDPAVSAVAERFAAGKVITKREAQYVTSLHFYATLFSMFSMFYHFSLILTKF